MDTIILIVVTIFLFLAYIGGMVSIYHVGLKKWWVWLFVIGVFISGFLFGLLNSDMNGGFEIGAILTLATLFSGSVTRWQRQNSSKKAESWLALHEHDSRFSLSTRLIKHYTKKQDKK